MSDINNSLLELGAGLRSLFTGLLSTQQEDNREQVLADARDSRNVKFGSEIRHARLYTEITVDGKQYSFEAAGARSCSTDAFALAKARGTGVYNLTCDLTYFAADDTPLGPVRIIQDPRIQTKGFIYLRRNDKGVYELPGLSFFNQHLIFHIGEKYFYYPRAWQVVSAITTWPPEYHQYHHLEEDTPVFDFLTKQPNVARKGISTISIEGPMSAEDEKRIRAAFAQEVKLVSALPASKMSPEDLTPAQGSTSSDQLEDEAPSGSLS